jgi:hypothetical protein
MASIFSSSSSGPYSSTGLDEEAVELRFRQRKDPLVLERVLGRDHDERRCEPMDLPVHGDMALLHGLEQRRLRPGRRSVDLVRE